MNLGGDLNYIYNVIESTAVNDNVWTNIIYNIKL